ncbi:MAG: TrkH family potassium uptake protein [Deltaproteobacteria bacterium]|nr:TrkH family potassium uptake protein [Deltaproteobacteria bacterium]
MRTRVILYLLGVFGIFLGFSMLLPAAISLAYKESAVISIFSSAVLTSGIGGVLFLAFKGERVEISHREGFAITAIAWIGAGFFGALPYLFSGALPNFVDAYFESIAGFTTTDATVFQSVENLPHGILLWRSLTHWIGGMGIILLSIAILPILGIGGMQLYRAEATGIGVSSDKLAPRLIEVVKLFGFVYLGITTAEIIALALAGMTPFDAVIHAFGTVATGGFSNKNISVEYYRSPLIEFILIVFMFIAATNFALHANLLRRGPRVYWENSEFRFYLGLQLTAIIFVAINLYFSSFYQSISSAFRHASFQVASIQTSTGFSSADFVRWPSFSQLVLFVLMLVGGSTGSTTGGIKCLRIVLLLKQGYKELRHLIHPHAVIPIKLGNRVVPNEVMTGAIGFTFLYMLIFFIVSMAMTFLGLDIISAISSVAATLGNIGPGLGVIGPLSNFSEIPYIGKWLLIFCMLLGRLEIYTLLILFTPIFWEG